jgi:hypothetical protein
MKHPNYETIVAWASGKTIQYRGTTDDYNKSQWIDFEELFFNTENVEWRIKPKIKMRKCRVALFKVPEVDFYYTKNDDGLGINDSGVEDFENSPSFVKWLTDWIEYEVEE